MPLAKAHAISLVGLNGSLVEVEADISSNLPGFVIVGLPDASLNEASARVRSATANSGLALPNRKLTINLSPAAVPKHGSSFDLAIAIAALRASAAITNCDSIVFIGELGLDGSVRAVRGVLPAVLSARRLGFERVFVPSANLAEAELVTDVSATAVSTLAEAAGLLGAKVKPAQVSQISFDRAHSESDLPQPATEKDICEVLGHPFAIEALTVAAAGGHHLLMIGSPGVGKTMMAERLPSLLPDLDLERALETTALHSIAIANQRIGSQLVTRPPLEAPHHSASASALIGGGRGMPHPGLVSMAHNGVLFLDEAPEFQLPALESLRQALESAEVSIARAGGAARFPARFQLVLAANPCPCGLAMSKTAACRCSPSARQRYLARLSGPLLDRIDIRLRIREVNAAQIELDRVNPTRPTSAVLRERVALARSRSARRNRQLGFDLNAHAPSAALKRIFASHTNLTKPLDAAAKSGRLNLRGYDRCLRVALSVADLADREVQQQDIATAMVLRGEDNLGVA